MKKHITIAGDPIWDVYITLANGQISSKRYLPGGALNVYENAKAIANSNIECIWLTPEVKEKYYLYRLNDVIINLHTSKEKKYFYSSQSLDLLKKIKSINLNKFSKKLLLLSDYNKGFLNSTYQFMLSPKYDILVVDSKYRSLNSNFINLASTKIWRCTGSEFNSNFAKKFDFTIRTDGESEIKVFDKNINLIYTFPVPKINFTPHTCGAGDTFTAALSLKLLDQQEFNLAEAIEFAIRCSIDVIKKPETAITDIKL